MNISPFYWVVTCLCFIAFIFTRLVVGTVRFRSRNTKMRIGRKLSTVDEYVDFLVANTGSVSFTVIGSDSLNSDFSLNGSVPRSLASTVKIMVLVGYAYKVSSGELKTTDCVKVRDLNKWYLRGLDGGAHAKSVRHMRHKGRISDAGELKLSDVVEMMIRFSSNAAADCMMNILGLDFINTLQEQMFKDEHLPIQYISGQILFAIRCMRGIRGRKWESKWKQYTSSDMVSITTSIMSKHVRSLAMRLTWRVSLWTIGVGGNLAAQSRILHQIFSSASVQDYSKLMYRVVRDDCINSGVSSIIQKHLQWATEPNLPHTMIGMKGGALPGMITGSYYARMNTGSLAMSLFVNNIPVGTWSSVVRTGIHHRLVLKLIEDADFRDYFTKILKGPATH